jgi:hypothetical protein
LPYALNNGIPFPLLIDPVATLYREANNSATATDDGSYKRITPISYSHLRPTTPR